MRMDMDELWNLTSSELLGDLPFLGQLLSATGNGSDTILPADNISFTLNDEEELSYIPLGKHLETYLAPPVFTLIFGVGLIGNGTLMLIFLRNKAMRSVPNIYIMSLSLGDLFVITGTVPFICAIYVLDSWPFGLFLCKLSEFMRDLSIGVTVLTLTMLSIDRYIAIALPLYKRKGGRHDRRVTIVITCLVWFIASLMAIPGAYFSYLGEAHLPGRPPIVYCHPFPQHMQPWYPRLMVMMKFLVQYVIPLIVIATFYILMSRSLIKTAKSTLCDQKNAAAKKQQKARVKLFCSGTLQKKGCQQRNVNYNIVIVDSVEINQKKQLAYVRSTR